jgi:hypothetical protein
MTRQQQSIRKNFIRIQAIGASLLISLLGITMPISAAQSTQSNSQFDIFNEASLLFPPMSEQKQSLSATVVPLEEKANVKFINRTNAAIVYEVIGHTDKRILPGKSHVALKDLPANVTVTFRRSDRGLLAPQPQLSSATGLLKVTLDEATDLGADRIAMKLEQGSVFFK